eukprot:m.94472 g.94472  ORF g.94472 m.94472 type:complete len:450 (-) comp12249_c0_seq1:199-1548(-)
MEAPATPVLTWKNGGHDRAPEGHRSPSPLPHPAPPRRSCALRERRETNRAVAARFSQTWPTGCTRPRTRLWEAGAAAPSGRPSGRASAPPEDAASEAVDRTLTLPDEILVAVFLVCPLEALVKKVCGLVCRRWWHLVQTPAVRRRMWRCRWEGYVDGWLAPVYAGISLGDQSGNITVGPDGTVYCVDGKQVVAISGASRQRLWALEHRNDTFALAVTPDNTVYTTSFDRTVKVWDGATGGLIRTLRGHDRAVFSVVVDPPTHRVFTGDFRGVIRVWSHADGRSLAVHDTGLENVRTLALHAGRLYTGSDDGAIHVWSSADFAHLTELTGHTGHVSALTIEPHGKGTLYSGSYDGTVRAWDPEAGAAVKLLLAGNKSIEGIACDHRGQVYVTGEDNDRAAEFCTFLRIYSSRRTGNELLYTIHNWDMSKVTVAPNGSILTAASLSMALVW